MVLGKIFASQKIVKKEFFLREGQVCKNMAFIVKGAMRQYHIEDDGTPHMVNLLIENWWAVDRESFAQQAPSVYNIDAWEDTELLVASKTDWLAYQDELPAFNAMVRTLDEKHAIATQKRMKAMVSYPAEKRFADLKDRYPELLDRFPQHLIASYLGITKETLSRIRHQASKK